ncbi:MAG: HIT family protein [Candidatus Liptonbacteria bacterium]|nr:HIT family protein [Candidatus Liptonbacteria bacterium]
MKSCLFCAIAKKEIPANVVYEDKDNLAFLDVKPRAPGHVLVVPKIHTETILDLKEGQGPSLLKALVKVEQKLYEVLSPDGLTVGINEKEAAGQEINHLHIHIIPRFFGDGGGSIQSVVDNQPKESLNEVLKKFKLTNG